MAAFLGLLSLGTPGYLRIEGDDSTRLMVVMVALFFSGALTGCICRHRVWRWPVASVIAFAGWDCVNGLISPTAIGSAMQVVLHTLGSNSPLYALYGFPVLVGAYVGAALMNEGLA